ncbi:MAG: hypothetical protein WC975_11085 [Phycisphaerae bacterium]
MNECYLLLAARYIELNPVRANLVHRAEDYPWSSAAAHCRNCPDPLASPCAIFEDSVADWRKFLAEGVEESDQKSLRRHECTGRPLGNETFLNSMERILIRTQKILILHVKAG